MASAGARLLLFCAGLLAVTVAAASDLGAGDAGAPPGTRVRQELPADTADHRMRRATTGLPVRLRPPSLSFPTRRPHLPEVQDTPREEGASSRGLASRDLTSGVLLSNVGIQTLSLPGSREQKGS